jgi:hypothetical protein
MRAREAPTARALAAAVAPSAADGDLRMLVLHARPGRRDLTCPARFEGPPIPVAALAGPQVVARRGAAHAVAANVRGATRVGPHRTAVWYELWAPGDDASLGWRRLTQVLGHLGEAVPGYLDPNQRSWGGYEPVRR